MIKIKDIDKKIEINCSITEFNKPYLKVKSAKFECPSCGSVLSVLQLDKKFREPTRCSCGRRGGFRVLSKELVEAQDIKIREKDSGFEYKVYIEGQKIIDKLKELTENDFLKLKGLVRDEYKKNSTKGEYVIEAEKINIETKTKPGFLG